MIHSDPRDGAAAGKALAGKVALVTGGTRGLGLAIARGFAAEGATLVVASRKAESVQHESERIASDFGVPAFGIAVNVGDWGECDRLAEEAYAATGAIDILVNNVGMSPRYEGVADITAELYDKVLNVNLRSAFRLSAVIGSRMAERGSGSIINISSNAALRPMPHTLPYGIAKAGVNALTLGMAATLGPGVRVNAILAGPFDTDIAQHWTPEVRARATAAQALGRVGQPHEIVGAALYFAGESSSFTTGAILAVHGGLR